jgi:hypothetical protein
MKRYFEVSLLLLLLGNGVFLYLTWTSQQNPSVQPSGTNDISTYEKELTATLLSIAKRPLTIEILVRKNHCGSCIEQALMYSLLLVGRVPIVVLYHSPSPSQREGERFAQQFGIPESLVVRHETISQADSLLWSGNGPTAVVRDTQDGARYLIHISSSSNRARTETFYKTLLHAINIRSSQQ